MNGWTKIIVGTTLALVIGGIFWLGAAYQRFSGMEGQLVGIRSAMDELVKGQADIKEVIYREDDQQKRIEKLEEEIRKLR